MPGSINSVVTRARDGGLRFGEMERDCVVKTTPISQTFGRALKIGDMSDSGWDVLAWNGKSLVKSKQTNYLDKGNKECIELRLEDDRVITYTENHKLLNHNKKWIKIKDLDMSKDRITVGVNYPLMDINQEMKEMEKWTMTVGDLTLKADTVPEFLKSLAFARMMGILITNSGNVFFSHKLDADQFLDDLNLFVKNSKFEKKDNYYSINVPQEFSKNLIELKDIPEFILNENCPKPIIREFLAGMFGSNGRTCHLGMHREHRDLLTSVSYSRSVPKSKVNELNNHLENIKNILTKFGVNSATIQKPKTTIDSEDNQLIETVLHIGIDNLLQFHKEIGFRYCCHKSQRLEAGVSYKRLREGIIRQHNWITNRVDELTDFTKIKAEHPDKKVRTKAAIEQAVKEINKSEGLLHKYAIPTTHDITDHLIKGTKFGKFNKGKFFTADEYLESVGAKEWFDGEFGVNEDAEGLPTMDLKIISMKKVGPKPVCDISVNENHSFVADGVVAHNCMIAHGMAQFLKERLVNVSDQYFVHICSNCGLFARKKPNKDIYLCQMCSDRGIRYTTHKIEIPYAFKLLVQELMAINIVPKLKVKDSIYNSSSLN